MSFERLMKEVSAASGWGVSGTFVTFHVLDGGVGACVEICGSNRNVSAWGKDHDGALVKLLQNIEDHYRAAAEWYVQRCLKARTILGTLDINYVKIGVTPC